MTRSARRVQACALLAVLALLTGCTSRVEEPSAKPSASSSSANQADAKADRREAVAVMKAREKALQAGDRKAWLATVSPTSSSFLELQGRYFDNLAKLPVTHISFHVGDTDRLMQISSEGDYQLPVNFTMQLQGFDASPVTIPLIYTFKRRAGHLQLVNDRNPQNDVSWKPAPWDVTAIEVRRTDDLLGLFDKTTVGDADEVMSQLQDALDVISPLVPSWRNRVVVYDISDLKSMDQMSLMELNNTAGIQFDVPVRPRSQKVASSRFAVNPTNTDTSSRSLVFRHELVHVALGDLDESSPTWLVEGAAESVARTVYTVESLQAQARLVLSDIKARPLATGRDFYQVRPNQNYELGALVCTYLINTRGRETLWTLMRAFDQAVKHHDIVAAGDIDTVTKKVLGLTTKELEVAALDWASVPHT
jgi:hypothetical protein